VKLLGTILLLCFFSPVSSIQFVDEAKCGGKPGETCLSTPKDEFFLLLNADKTIRYFEISTLKTRHGYNAGVKFYRNGYLSEITPRKWVKNSKYGLSGEPVGWHFWFYENGVLAAKKVDSGVGADAGIGFACGWEYRYDGTGMLLEKKYEPRNCPHGKGIVRFFLPPGQYRVITAPLRLRQRPSLNGEVIRNLNAETVLEVTDYTADRLEINGFYAPWARVKIGKIEGWVYGGYIEPVEYGKTYRKFFQNIDWHKFVEKMALE
jgi:hypothetical protein